MNIDRWEAVRDSLLREGDGHQDIAFAERIASAIEVAFAHNGIDNRCPEWVGDHTGRTDYCQRSKHRVHGDHSPCRTADGYEWRP